jgi:hypothetical protein
MPKDWPKHVDTNVDTVLQYPVLSAAHVNKIQTLVFLMEAHSVLWETGTEYFYIVFKARKVPTEKMAVPTSEVSCRTVTE